MKRTSAFLALTALTALALPALAGTIKGRITIPRARTLADVVVYVDKAPGTFPAPKAHAVINQKDLAFVPHVMPIVAGTTVDFLNSDQVLHNVFSPDKCVNKFNLGTWPKGEVRSYTFANVGCASVVLCNVHPEMEGFVLALQNPFYAVTDKSGLFVIKDVPEGRYTIKAWNRKYLDVTQDVAVPKEGDVPCNLALK